MAQPDATTLQNYARALVGASPDTTPDDLRDKLKHAIVNDRATYAQLRVAGVMLMRNKVLDGMTRPATEDDAGKGCPICYESFAAGTQLAVVEGCKHAFCRPCLATWANANKNSCPMCRNALSSSKLFLHRH